MRYYLSPPHQSGRELIYLQEALESNYIAPLGPFVDRFEKEIKTYVGSNALALCSATAGLHLALRVLGIEESDKVAVSDFTFVASLNPILYQKATPVLIDCDETWQIDPNALEEALQKERPKAVIVTHIYGQSAKIDTIKELCDHYGSYLIEDAAEALGSKFLDRHTGTFGTFGVYSFNGNKLLTTGGGGVLVSSDEELLERARVLSAQAKDPKYPWYEHATYGYNYRLSNILAAIGVAQMEVIEERIAKKRQIFEWYQEELQEYATFMPQIPQSHGNRWLTTAIFDIDPLKIYHKLQTLGIETRPLWKPMHLQPLCKGLRWYGQGIGQELFARGLCLPSGTQMEQEDVAIVAKEIKRCL
ncbi:MAG: aminotransferase DegT [Epsilonproteobacteria bacterium]|nr:aminotransferase DegT [Campylobacterota bacterium]NPA64438.1 aminotransferase class V-fold PLP-dependent enzyme [Campylobacterota bacterium]